MNDSQSQRLRLRASVQFLDLTGVGLWISHDLVEHLEKRKEKANLLEKIRTLEVEILKVKTQNGSLRAKLRLILGFSGPKRRTNFMVRRLRIPRPLNQFYSSLRG